MTDAERIERAAEGELNQVIPATRRSDASAIRRASGGWL